MTPCQAGPMGCVFCGYKESRNVHICSGCTQKVLSLSPEDIIRGHTLAVEKGYTAIAEALTSFMEEDDHVPETGYVRRRVVRTRPVRQAAATRQGYHRQEHSVEQLDTGRVAVR